MNALSEIKTTDAEKRTSTQIVPRCIYLPGGPCAIYCFTDLDAQLPEIGMIVAEPPAVWNARWWSTDGIMHGLAVVGTTALRGLQLNDADGNTRAEISLPGTFSTEAAALAAFLRDTDAPLVEILQFLGAALSRGELSSESASRFHTALLHESSQADGFVEILVQPDCGGIFVQGWAHSRLSGSLNLLGAADGLQAMAMSFLREDIFAPAVGFCIYVKDFSGTLDGSKTLFVEQNGRPLRLDILENLANPIRCRAADDHVRAMLPRLIPPSGEDADGIEAFKRILRPRFTGENTLETYGEPITAAVDRILRTPEGGVFISGWLLDPLEQVDRVILKSTGALYAPMHTNWHRFERPDLNQAFDADPRFAGLLDPRETLHGFIYAFSVDSEAFNATDLYLEIVLKDDACLFLPCKATLCGSPSAAHPVLNALQPHDPGLSRLIADHVVPFLSTVPSAARQVGKHIVQTLGGGPAGRAVAAVMPLRDGVHINPILACLSGSAEADALDLILVTGRDGAAALSEDLDDQFHFYGLRGALVLVPDHETLADRLDAGARVTDAADLLVWQTSVLPKTAGWLASLRQCRARADGPAVVSPLMCYEDGSVYFGGTTEIQAPPGAVCALVGFDRRRVDESMPRRAAGVPAELALVDRALLRGCGGFRGKLWGDRLMGQDLSFRLKGAGAQAWCAPAAEFWMLDAAAPEGNPAEQALIDRVDSGLLALQRAALTSELTA